MSVARCSVASPHSLLLSMLKPQICPALSLRTIINCTNYFLLKLLEKVNLIHLISNGARDAQEWQEKNDVPKESHLEVKIS